MALTVLEATRRNTTEITLCESAALFNATSDVSSTSEITDATLQNKLHAAVKISAIIDVDSVASSPAGTLYVKYSDDSGTTYYPSGNRGIVTWTIIATAGHYTAIGTFDALPSGVTNFQIAADTGATLDGTNTITLGTDTKLIIEFL